MTWRERGAVGRQCPSLYHLYSASLGTTWRSTPPETCQQDGGVFNSEENEELVRTVESRLGEGRAGKDVAKKNPNKFLFIFEHKDQWKSYDNFTILGS
jgi:hypothetical protein